MSKSSEQRALEAYPEDISYSTVLERPFDYNGHQRMIFQKAYEQAEKDLAMSYPLPEDTVLFQKGVAEGRRLEREDGLAWQDIKSIVQIADKMLDDPKARVAFQNHNEEYYYKRVLEQYNNSRNEANSVD